MVTLTRTKRDDWRGSYLKCKQPPKPDGCLTPQPNPHDTILCESSKGHFT